MKEVVASSHSEAIAIAIGIPISPVTIERQSTMRAMKKIFLFCVVRVRIWNRYSTMRNVSSEETRFL